MVQRGNMPVKPIPRNRGDGLDIGEVHQSGKSMASCLNMDEVLQWQNTPRPGTLTYIQAQANRRSAEGVKERNYIRDNIKSVRYRERVSGSARTPMPAPQLPMDAQRSSCLQRYFSDLKKVEQVNECVGIPDDDDDDDDDCYVESGTKPRRRRQSSTNQAPSSVKGDSEETNISSLSLAKKQHSCEGELNTVQKFPTTPPAGSSSTKHSQFLRAHEKSGLSTQDLVSLSGVPLKPVMARSDIPTSIPRACSARDLRPVRQKVDFVRANAHAISCNRLNRSSKEGDKYTLNSAQSRPPSGVQRTLRLGQIPPYLIKRQQEAAEAELLRKKAEESEVPPGHRKMSEAEHQDTLRILQQLYMQTMDELGHLPIHLDTYRIRNRRTKLEEKLVEMEAIIATFSKPVVYVKID